ADPPGAGPRPVRRRALAIGLGAGAALGAGGWAVLHRADPPGPRVLPPLTYRLIDGRRLGPAELGGKAVLVNFWATSCAVCVAEMPELASVYEAYRARGLELVAVAMPYDRPDHVLHFASTRRLPFPVALDPMGEAVAGWGGVDGTPLTWLAGPDGRIRRRWLGRPDFAALRRELDSLLPAPPA
ncbi:MAG: TlpA family protein disulfide reductase, partial [Burkholderiales bacterium]